MNFMFELETVHFTVVCLVTWPMRESEAKKRTKVKNARAGRAKPLFLPTKYANL